MNTYKGIILASGPGMELRPMTTAVNKHLLPIYDKPMIYYPLSVMAQMNIREIMIISTNDSLDAYKALLGDGTQFGMDIQYAIQDKLNGVAESLILAEDFIAYDNVCLMVGDNFFFGPQLQQYLIEAKENNYGATLFAYPVVDPHRFSTVKIDKSGYVTDIVARSGKPESNNAVTGLYFFDNLAMSYAHKLSPAYKGELEIVEISNRYLQNGKLNVKLLSEDCLWFEIRTYESLLQTSNLVRDIQQHQNIQIGCIEEVALENGWIDPELLKHSAALMANTSYGNYLQNIYSMHV